MKHCQFCDCEAEYIIVDTNSPICSACKDVYECGQASPDAEFEDILD